MIPFDFQPRTRIVFGPDCIRSLGQLASELGARRALVVSDPGIVRAGHTQLGIDALASAGVETFLFEDVQENPSTLHVEAGVKFARRHEPQLIVGLGGGSSMDCAKGINFLYSGGGRMQDYWGVGKALKEMLPMIAVPTTAGTGSEAQSFALISDAETKVKMACGDKKASCRIALLDPALTVTQPARVTALTGVDAIAHAVETFVTTKRNAASLAFSREAWLLLAGNFAKVLAQPHNVDARGGMQLGACFAGLAIENSMLGAAHALANPLTAHYGVIHGQAIGVMLPHVIRFNGQTVGDLYVDLLETTAHCPGCPAPSGGPEALADFVAQLATQAGLPSRLGELGVAKDKLPELAADAARQWTGTFNPRPVAAEELHSLYLSAF
ncbi:MAG: iron-containing alcohol dehydrogenase [Planctomycetales bacterium]|nr:iron-containing alcohol dehydrogenase [Planctomycetales bacterium]